MSNKNSLVGILLAGGLSRRYGSPKAFATWKDQSFYEVVYQTLHSVCDEVVIVTRPELKAQFRTNYHVIKDVEEFSGCGPLAGIYSGMRAIEADNYVVLPCDMPLITSAIMEKLVTFHTGKVTVINVDGYLQPLVSIWNKEVKSIIYSALKQGQFKPMDVLVKTDTVKIEADLLSETLERFMNINTPTEDKEMRKWKES